MRLSIDPDIDEIVQAGYSFDHFVIGVTWPNDLFKIQSRTNLVAGDWADVPGATNSPFMIIPTQTGEFYRLIQQ